MELASWNFIWIHKWKFFARYLCHLTVWYFFQAGGKAGKDTGKAKAKAVSRSARAGLQVFLLEVFLWWATTELFPLVSGRFLHGHSTPFTCTLQGSVPSIGWLLDPHQCKLHAQPIHFIPHLRAEFSVSSPISTYCAFVFCCKCYECNTGHLQRMLIYNRSGFVYSIVGAWEYCQTLRSI